MVAFELARYFESKGNTSDAGRWYLTAAERFRRADWKTKAQESATRLGATEPAEIPAPAPRSIAPEQTPDVEPQADAVELETASATSVASEEVSESPAERTRSTPDSNGHRRGRRGDRNQHPSRRPQRGSSHRSRSSEQAPARAVHDGAAERPVTHRSAEPVPETPLPAGARGRFGDPGLSSRLSQLEMNFRRLLACPPSGLGDADKAPAGPGVWVLTDSDMSTYYYVEACQTLRVAIPHLLRGSAAKRGESIKPKLAEHLGIPESRVGKYLADHCVVRWLQMDEDAAHFAHFLIAVLHPALNE
jgi:hypothetical protein